MEKVKVPTSIVLDMEKNSKMAQAIETKLNLENEKGLTARYSSAAQFVLAILEEKLK